MWWVEEFLCPTVCNLKFNLFSGLRCQRNHTSNLVGCIIYVENLTILNSKKLLFFLSILCFYTLEIFPSENQQISATCFFLFFLLNFPSNTVSVKVYERESWWLLKLCTKNTFGERGEVSLKNVYKLISEKYNLPKFKLKIWLFNWDKRIIYNLWDENSVIFLSIDILWNNL